MDLSNLSDEDLKALDSGDLGSMSNEGLMHLHGQVAQQPSTAAFTPDQQAAEDERNKSLSPVQALAGAGQMAFNVAQAHPTIASGLGAAAGAAAFPNLAQKIPGVGQTMDLVRGGIDTVRDYNLNQAEHQAVQYMKAGQTPPPAFTERLDALRAQSAAKTPGVKSVPPTGTASAKSVPPGGTPGIMARVQQLAMDHIIQPLQQAAPRSVAALEPFVNNPVTRGAARVAGGAARVASNPFVTGMTYSPGLNTNEDAELARRRAAGEAYARQQGWIK